MTEVQRKALQGVLESLWQAEDIIVWMSGSADFAPNGIACVGWRRAQRKLVNLRVRRAQLQLLLSSPD